MRRPIFGSLKRGAAVLAAALAALMPLAASPAATGWRANADDALLFDLQSGRYRIGNGIRGYQTDNGVCVDFADMVMALDLPVRIDKQLGRATGWIFDERRTLTVDRRQFTVQTANERFRIDESAIRDTPEGWCVAVTELSRWLGVTLTADQPNALLFIKASQKLPFELAAERKARAGSIRPVAQFDLKTLPTAIEPYKGWRTPSVDAVVAIGGLRDAGRSGSRIDASYELFASGEVATASVDARLSSDQQGVPANLRLRAYRSDPDGRLLGPLRATHVAAGDVNGFATPLVAQSTPGRGAIVTNRPIERPDAFAFTSFRGVLPAGWDAELYRNGQLLGFANDRSDGRYEFLDVPLLFGQNRFEIVLYGPQGQIRREERTVPVGIDSIPPQKTWYWAGVSQDNRDLVTLRDLDPGRSTGWRGAFGLERGIDTRTSVSALLQTLVIDDRRFSFAEAALRRSIGPALGEFSASVEAGGGYAVRGALLGEFGRTFVSAESILAGSGYRSERVDRLVTGIHTLSLDHNLALGPVILPVHVDGRYLTRANGNDVIEASARVSASVRAFTLTGQLDLQQQKAAFGPDPPAELDATLRLNGRLGGVRLRGETRYRLRPRAEFEAATLVGEWNGGERSSWRAELGYERDFDRGRAGLGYVRRFSAFAITASAEAATDGSVGGGLNLAFSLGPDPRGKGRIRVTSDKLAAQGQALARVFFDDNGDGVRQPGEPVQRDVQLAAGRVPIERLTGADGAVVIDNLLPFEPVLIGIDASSLPDPLVQPATPGTVVVPRPGVATAIDLPLTRAGEVEGILVRGGGGGIEGVDLELLDNNDRVIRVARSDFDGFFLFEKVPYGRYRVRVARLSADAIRVDPALVPMLTVNAANPVVRLGPVTARPASGIVTTAAK